MTTTARPKSPCPPGEIWDQVASGLLTGDDALDALEHASWCEECARTLRSAIEIFGPASSPVVSFPQPTSRLAAPGKTAWRWIAAAATVLVTLGLGYLYWRSRTPEPLSMLAQAYTSNRTTDLRLPGASHGPMRVERGADVIMPTSAIEAELIFRRELEKNPENAGALHAKGRWELLFGSPDHAIEALQAARDLSNAKPDANLLTELGMAYRERAGRSGHATDRLHAIEFLGQALHADPTNAAALFDRAVVESELNQLGPAIADFEKLLQIEPSGAWSDEAREKLNAIRGRRTAFFQRRSDEDPSQFDEVALDEALLDLHAPSVAAVASRLKTHHDLWLQDLRAMPDTPWNRKAEEVLRRMAQIRTTFESARYAAEKATFDELYAARLPAPLEAWRNYESLYRATHARGEFRCPETGDAATKGKFAEYKWLVVQNLRERGFCSFQAGDVDSAESLARESIELARASRFPVSEIRSMGLRANVEWRRGMYRGAIDLAAASLNEIFAKHLPVGRSQEFYNMMMASAEDLVWWNAARAAAGAMTESADAAGFRDLRFTNTIHWAQLSLRCGDRVQAGAQFESAMNYFVKSAPRAVSRAWAEIGFADATGDESNLERFRQDLETSPDPMIWLPYERVKASLAFAAGRFGEAQAHLNRVSNWMGSPEASGPLRSKQWRGELKQAGELALRLLLDEGRYEEAFDFLQKWRSADQPSATETPEEGFKIARVPDENAVRFAVAEAGDRIAVWRADGPKLNFRWASGSRSDVARLNRRLTRMLESPESNTRGIDLLGKQIETLLFGSWLAEITPNRPVIIQGVESIGDLVTAVLPGLASRFGLEHPVAITSFALAAPTDRAPAFRPTATNLLLIDASEGNRDWAADLPRLASAAREIELIGRSANMPLEILKRGSISMDAIAEQLASTRVMHFAGHAVPTGSGVGLVLPDFPGPVFLHDLGRDGSGMPPTVVLSACSTGRRSLEDSAGPSSLAGAFLLEGAGEVIASLWNVDSEATAQLMTEFYRGLGAGLTTGRALQGAMNALARSGRFSHPYYWASFARFVRV